MAEVTCREHPGLIKIPGDKKHVTRPLLINLPAPPAPLSITATRDGSLYFGVHSSMPSYFVPIEFSKSVNVQQIRMQNYGTAFLSVYALDKNQLKVMRAAFQEIETKEIASFFSFQRANALTYLKDILAENSQQLLCRTPLIARMGLPTETDPVQFFPFDFTETDYVRAQATDVRCLFLECIPFAEPGCSPFASSSRDKKTIVQVDADGDESELSARTIPKTVARIGLSYVECITE